MKANKKSRFVDLSADVAEYMFTEWLVRQGIFSAYRANFERIYPGHRPFRDNLRDKIRFLCRPSSLGIECIISTSFLFSMTPEGFNFWSEKSNLWRHFCNEFKSIL